MKRNIITAILYFVSSICFYACAVISFIDKESMWAAYLCLGSTFLCLGIIYLSKNKKS